MTSEYTPKYENWTEADYLNDPDIRYCVPMTAHALEDIAEQDEKLSNPEYVVEEKFDGTRATLHFMSYGCRVFSRRISKKTNWFTENSDSLPQMRDLVIPELAGTVIDGEMFIPNRPFKDVSATMNCKWDKAIERQKELGDVVLHAFDILYYKGMSVKNLSLKRRKVFLHYVIKTLEQHGVTCIVEVPFIICGAQFFISRSAKECKEMPDESMYPELYSAIKNSNHSLTFKGNAKAYYEHIVFSGGEGVILKDINGKYEHKRSKGFLKIKKFYTRECILIGFSEPTKYYDGKFPDDSWDYWEDPSEKVISNNWGSFSAKELLSKGYKPITKFYYNKWVGNMQFGVIITPEEVRNLPKGKKFELFEMTLNFKKVTVLYVGECSGFDDDLRERLSETYIGKVIEVKCNEIFKDTGKLRHPRFLRFRDDKDPEDCTYHNHITEGL